MPRWRRLSSTSSAIRTLARRWLPVIRCHLGRASKDAAAGPQKIVDARPWPVPTSLPRGRRAVCKGDGIRTSRPLRIRVFSALALVSTLSAIRQGSRRRRRQHNSRSRTCTTELYPEPALPTFPLPTNRTEAAGIESVSALSQPHYGSTGCAWRHRSASGLPAEWRRCAARVGPC